MVLSTTPVFIYARINDNRPTAKVHKVCIDSGASISVMANEKAWGLIIETLSADVKCGLSPEAQDDDARLLWRELRETYSRDSPVHLNSLCRTLFRTEVTAHEDPVPQLARLRDIYNQVRRVEAISERLVAHTLLFALLKHGTLRIEHVRSHDNTADTLTKSLARPVFVKHLEGLGVCDPLERPRKRGRLNPYIRDEWYTTEIDPARHGEVREMLENAYNHYASSLLRDGTHCHPRYRSYDTPYTLSGFGNHEALIRYYVELEVTLLPKYPPTILKFDVIHLGSRTTQVVIGFEGLKTLGVNIDFGSSTMTLPPKKRVVATHPNNIPFRFNKWPRPEAIKTNPQE
ncbi:hypothetical protein B9479_007773, partial [Cryptococcus floricola]